MKLQVYKLPYNKQKLSYRVIINDNKEILYDRSFRTKTGMSLFIDMMKSSIETNKLYSDLVVENLMIKRTIMERIIKAKTDEEKDIIYEMYIGSMYTGNSEGKTKKSKENSIKSEHDYAKLSMILSDYSNMDTYKYDIKKYLFEIDSKTYIKYNLINI